MQSGRLGRNLPEQAAEQIREYIREHQLKPGDRIPTEFQLAELCGVGRSTIREAIRMLVFEHRVEIVRGNGTFVAEPEPEPEEKEDDPIALHRMKVDYETVLQFFEIRMMLEPEIAALAAANATAEDCRKLEKLCAEVERCIRSNESHLEADIAFHNQIAACSKNEIAKNLMEIVTKGISYFIEATGNGTTDYTLIYHRAILDAIRTGDAVGARCNMITHLNEPRNMILGKIEKKKNGEGI